MLNNLNLGFQGTFLRRLMRTTAGALVGLTFFAPFSSVFAAAGVPRIMSYQGRLSDASGVLLGGSGTEYCVRFSFYDDATIGGGDVKLWPSGSPSTMTVLVKKGVFSVGIGDTSVGGDTLDYNFQDTDATYVNVEVADRVGATCAPGDGAEVFENLSPRQRIFASGYAINAETVGGFTPTQGASANQIPVLSSGNLILGGTNPFLNATTTNTLTLQGGGQAIGDIQFFSSSNKITSQGNAIFAGEISAVGASLTSATSSNLVVTGSASTSNLTVSNGFTFGTVSGILKSVAGAVTAALVNLTSDVTGILGVANGGTGLADIVAGTLLTGNGSGTLATTTVGSTLQLTDGSLGLNLANPNTWTGLQVFSGSASTTAASALDYLAIGRTATTTIQGNTTGTSTIQGVINVQGANSTSTFSGNVATNRLAVTGNGTSTFAGGVDIAGGCIAKNGVCIDQGDVDGVTVTTFTSNSTWTKSNYAGLAFTQVITTGSGGGGGGSDGNDTTSEQSAGGGGAGGTSIKMIATASLGTTESVTVGTAGNAGSNVGGDGGNGNTSSFGSHNSANGGTGGGGAFDPGGGTCAAAGLGAGGGGGTAASGDINISGGAGTGPVHCIAELVHGGPGGASYWGGGGAGGTSEAANACSAGGVGAYGSGGGGAVCEDNTAGATGGAGGGGIVSTINYTSSSGDLAEWYETTHDVEPGDIVAISDKSYEYDSRLGLQKSSILERAVATRSTFVVGVVATAPYETIGGDTLGKATHPSSIALAGRVPVKVSLENGPIVAGDLLTVSSKPGVAMRSKKAGVVIGNALEDALCKEETQCTVLVMVNTSYSTGALIKVAMRDVGIDMDAIPANLDQGRIILAEMLQNKTNITASSTLSEVSADRIAAGLEIVTPRIVANTLVAGVIEPVEKDVHVALGEGGRFVISKVHQEDLSFSFDNGTTTPRETSISIDALGNALFAGQLTAANFEVGTKESPGGITMYDRDTKESYCLLMAGGSLKTTKGKCDFSSGSLSAAVSLFADEPPVIIVHGENPAHIAVGEKYVDEGASVSDDHDANVELRAMVNGENLENVEPDTGEPSHFMIIYRAIDSEGHASEAMRTVIVGGGFIESAPHVSATTTDADPKQESPKNESTSDATTTEAFAPAEPASAPSANIPAAAEPVDVVSEEATPEDASASATLPATL